MARLAIVLLLGACTGASLRTHGTGEEPDAALATEPDAMAADAGAEAPRPPLLRDGAFDLAAYDTGNLEHACTTRAPWGPTSWGIEAATFTDPSDRRFDRAHFVAGNHQAYLYGLDDSGKLGFVRFIQGDVWGGGNCGPIPWHVFAPVPTAGKALTLDLDVYLDTSKVFGTTDGWLMVGVNAWFSSPDFVAGGDRTGHKPLVMDLIAHYACAHPPCSFASAEDRDAYHYQAEVAQAARGAWTHLTIPLDPHIEAAFQRFGLPAAARRSLVLSQLELVIEVRHAEGAASIDNYVVSGIGLP